MESMFYASVAASTVYGFLAKFFLFYYMVCMYKDTVAAAHIFTKNI